MAEPTDELPVDTRTDTPVEQPVVVEMPVETPLAPTVTASKKFTVLVRHSQREQPKFVMQAASAEEIVKQVQAAGPGVILASDIMVEEVT